MRYETVPVWSLLLRLYHWILALSIVCLAVTGWFIHTPWATTNLEGQAAMPMLTMRNLHFLAGYCFGAAILLRCYLLIFGNRYETPRDLLPVSGRNLRNLGTTLRHYLYLGPAEEGRMGHNVLAGMSYVLTLVAALFQLLSGFFLLYPESGLWQSWGTAVFGSQQQARFIHHILMWYFLFFAMIHIYLVIWNEINSPDGLVSSIFSGRKFRVHSP